MKLIIVIVAFFIFGCSKQECDDKQITLRHLSDINLLMNDGHKCDTVVADYDNSRLNKCKVLFADANYKLAADSYKSHILFDKNNNVTMAIVRPFPSVKIEKYTPLSLYILDKKLMPVFSITKLSGKEYRVIKYIYDKGKVHVHEAENIKGNRNLNVKDLTYKEVLELIHKIRTYNYKDTGTELEEYFYDTPYWTEGFW
jgi:hypothetical protein